MTHKESFLISVALLAITSGCMNEVPEIPKDELYTREFIKQFGLIDQNQDWNFATSVNVSISGDYPSGSLVRIFDSMPGGNDCHFVAEFSTSATGFSFDYPKNAERAYIQIVSADNKILESSYVPVVNSTLHIAGTPLSRAVNKPDGIKLFDFGADEAAKERIGVFGPNYGFAGDYWPANFPGRFNENKAYPLLDVFPLYGLCADNADMTSYKETAQKGLFSDMDNGRSVADLKAIVGPDGVFKEGACNLGDFKAKLSPQAGVEFTARGGEVSIEYLYGCGNFQNSLGYFYYDEGDSYEDILTAPRFILILDAKSSSNLMVDRNTGNYVPLGQDLEETSFGVIDKASMSPKTDIDSNNDSYRYKPSFHKLIYYPLDENRRPKESEATYNFPKGKKIGFFIAERAYDKLFRQQTVTGEVKPHDPGNPSVDYGTELQVSTLGFRYSLPWINRLFGIWHAYDRHSNCNATSFGFDASLPGPASSIPAMSFVTYNWMGETILGVEDGCQHDPNIDHDMNDILFIVRGTEGTDNDDFAAFPYAQSWIIACEDLGGTHDFDFNDVVFGVSHVKYEDPSKNFIAVTALAAGGILPVQLLFNGEEVCGHTYSGNNIEIPDPDIHLPHWNSWFGHDSASGHMTNTMAGDDFKIGRTIFLQVDADYSITETSFKGEDATMGGFSLRVTNGEETEIVTPPGIGSSPQMMLLPNHWQWPQERIHIYDAYSGVGFDQSSFGDWCNNANLSNWVNAPSSQQLVVKHNFKGYQLKH